MWRKKGNPLGETIAEREVKGDSDAKATPIGGETKDEEMTTIAETTKNQEANTTDPRETTKDPKETTRDPPEIMIDLLETIKGPRTSKEDQGLPVMTTDPETTSVLREIMTDPKTTGRLGTMKGERSGLEAVTTRTGPGQTTTEARGDKSSGPRSRR